MTKAIPIVVQRFGAESANWSYEKVVECAELCPTYKEFYQRFPLPYSAAKSNGWIPAVLHHCGWQMVNGISGPSQSWYRTELDSIMKDDGSIMPDAYGDPTWPVDLNERSALAELV